MLMKWAYLLVLVFHVVAASGQAIIPLRNPSMEALPGPAKTPSFWHFCGPPQETPPDVHPSGAFGIQKKAAHGQTYIGLVVRDNGTTEKISQRLETPLKAGQTYRFQCYVARPEIYRSISRSTMQPDSFTRAIRLRLWGVQHCEKIRLLGSTPLITNTDWQLYQFEFTPDQTINGIMFEAWYDTEEAYYNGGIFLDLVSPIYKVSQSAIHPPSIPALSDTESLRSFIYQETQKIKLTNTDLLHKEFIIDSDSCYYFTALPLWDIGRMLSKSAKAKVHVAATSKMARHQREVIMEALQLGGLPASRIKWHRLKKPPKGKRWMASDPKQQIFIGLSGI